MLLLGAPLRLGVALLGLALARLVLVLRAG
jgi:hypothetical protein